MSNAPKSGFWSSIPGMITATAGFLSAATGAIVALNQTGVVDLKKMTGAKPAEQSTPLTEPVASGTAQTKPADTKPAVEGGVATAVKKEDPALAPAPSRPVENPAPISNPAPQPSSVTKPVEPEKSVWKPAEVAKPATATQGAPTIATKSDAPVMPAPAPSTDKELLPAPSPRDRVAETRSPEVKQAPPSSPPRDRVAETKSPEVIQAPPSSPPRDRVAETKSPEVKQAPPSSPPTRPEAERPATRVDKKPVEATQPEVKKAPPPPDVKQPAPRPLPEERKADTKSPDRGPSPRTSPDQDPGKPKIVRAPGDQVADSRNPKDKDVDRDKEPGKKKELGGPAEVRSAGPDRSGMVDLAGLKLSMPGGWVKSDTQPSAAGADVSLRIPDPAGDGTVQIMRYMGAKGQEMEDRTIERWLGQVIKANGVPLTRGDAKIQRRQQGPIRVTTVELAGMVKSAGRGGDPDQKMIGAIIDHPAGPHLITISGPAKSMAKWDSQIEEFLRSAKPE